MTNSKACFSFVLIFAFFVSSHHVLAREFPNDNVEVDDLKGSTNNNILWTIPLTPTKTEEDHYSRNPHQGNDPVLPMLFFRRNKNKKPPETSTHTPPKPQPEQHIHNPNTHPHPYYPNDPPTHPYYPNDPPTNFQRPNPLTGVIPLLDPLIRGQNGEDPESEKVDPESKKIPPPDDGEEDSMDNIAHHSIGYNPYSSNQYQSSGFEKIGKRFSAYNMEEVDELKGSNNNLEWTIPLKPTKIEKDHYTNPSIGNYHRDSYQSNTPILPMLLFRKRRPESEPHPDPPHGPNHDPNTGSHGPHHDPPHGPHHDPPHGPNSGPYHGPNSGPYHDPNTGRYNPYNGPDYYGDGSGMDYPSDPSIIWQYWNTIKNWGRKIKDWYYSNPNNPQEESPPVDEDEPSSDRPHSSIGYNPYRSYQYYVPSALPQTQSNNYYTLPFSYNPNHYLQWNHLLKGGYSANFAAYQPSPFQHIEAENYKDGNVVWNHKMKSPSEIGWSTNYGDNKEPMN
ncbi:hypothetical protein HN51_058381 [Arachis hypogaea]|uniref:sporozoite surface protein 2-like isoform X2 n=1 Tax=Arachis ipaensis TaxID=130454 RepID=UPI0007AFACD5|nr:sporozoite surface protein 2-like isoform X2 [Arachis ipaensis]XP_025685987.1 sporozoite surface protein 2 isoform X2 [Arachis hypogaea]QHN81659.1 uncharacterized protein DS421_20g688810 [Arachis hypogaea]